MKLGGRCPLNNVRDQETFLRNEIDNFYKTNTSASDLESMRKIFCRSICKNVMC